MQRQWTLCQYSTRALARLSHAREKKTHDFHDWFKSTICQFINMQIKHFFLRTIQSVFFFFSHWIYADRAYKWAKKETKNIQIDQKRTKQL